MSIESRLTSLVSSAATLPSRSTTSAGLPTIAGPLLVSRAKSNGRLTNGGGSGIALPDDFSKRSLFNISTRRSRVYRGDGVPGGVQRLA